MQVEFEHKERGERERLHSRLSPPLPQPLPYTPLSRFTLDGPPSCSLYVERLPRKLRILGGCPHTKIHRGLNIFRTGANIECLCNKRRLSAHTRKE